jgi:hypothetical protein
MRSGRSPVLFPRNALGTLTASCPVPRTQTQATYDRFRSSFGIATAAVYHGLLDGSREASTFEP